MTGSEEIYEHAKACEEAFSRISYDPNAPSYVVAETLRQRFEQWSSNMGVSAVPQFSLDTRLAHSESLRGMVLDLLELMKTALDRVDEVRVDDEASETQESIIEQMRAEEAPEAMLRRMLSGKAQDAGGNQMSASEMHEALVKQMARNPGNVASVLVESLRTIKSVVDSLDRLGSAIRQSSSAERLTERIQKYMKRSNDGGVLEDIVYARLKFMLVDGRKYDPVGDELPGNAREATLLLCRQLAVSVAYRYYSIMYKRHHEQKRLEIREAKPQGLQKETHKHAAPSPAVIKHEKKPHIQGPSMRPSAIPSHLRTAPSVFTASDLSRPESAVAKKKYASSQASFRGASSVVSIQPGNVTLPKPPTIVAPAVDAACPYCLVRFHKNMYANERWWEHHVQNDLKLYTCIAEDCCQPPLLFSRYKDWKKHMDDTHTPQWTMHVHSPASWWCDLDHDEEWFSKEEDYESHMRECHADQMEGYDMDDMKDLATAKQPRTPDTCPICNCIPPKIKPISNSARGISTEEPQQRREELLKHIAQHLKEIGLLSVGYLDDNDKEGSEASRNASVASLRSRKYLPKAVMADGAWVFDDTGLADYVDVDYKSSDLLFEDTQTNNLPEWQILWKADLLDEEQTLRDHVDFAEKWRSPPEVAQCREALESWLVRFAQTQKLDGSDNVAGSRFDAYNLSPRDEAGLISLCLTDPRHDKEKIQTANGGIIRDTCHWIFENDRFQEWRSSPPGRVLWIRGDPRMGKTMLLCGIIDELDKLEPGTDLSYFFCQAMDTDRSYAAAVISGLIYMLILQRPTLISHLYDVYKNGGFRLSPESEAWQGFCRVLTGMLCDEHAENAILVVDALDECTSGLPDLLRFMHMPSRAKWIVSSSNWPDTGLGLTDMDENAVLHLELNQSNLSDSMAVYIRHRVKQLARKKMYDNHTNDAIVQQLIANANGNFLWVALACDVLGSPNIQRPEVLEMAVSLPRGVSPLYSRMVAIINELAKDRDICKDVLAIASTVYEPISISELSVLCASLESCSPERIHEIIQLCGCFLTVRNGLLHFVRQSAKDYLVSEAPHHIFPSGIADWHATIASRSLKALSSNLRRDMYGLNDPGYRIADVSKPDYDPLASIRYSCLFWVDHLEMAGGAAVSLQCDGQVHRFLQEKFLYWLEALSLLKSIMSGYDAVKKLHSLALGKGQLLGSLIDDARQFLSSFEDIIRIAPLQAYASALLFSPQQSQIRQLFESEMLGGAHIVPVPTFDDDSDTDQPLGDHMDVVTAVVFSPDGKQLASGSVDRTIKFWDTTSGECLRTLTGHTDGVLFVAFSLDGKQLASGSVDRTIKFWDTTSGECLRTLTGHTDGVLFVAFSLDGKQLASGSDDNTVKLWDTMSGECLYTLTNYTRILGSITFSQDGKQLASGLDDYTVKLLNTTSGECLRTLTGHANSVTAVTFSPDGKQLASGSFDDTVKLWDTTSGKCLRTLTGHTCFIESVTFSPDGKQLASRSSENTVRLWDTTSGERMQTLEGRSQQIPFASPSNGKQYDVSAYREWITKNGHNVLWLPKQWQTKVYSISGQSIGIGSRSGRVIIIIFND